MQRKNNLLKPLHRSGIAMIMAISVLVVLATIMAFTIQMNANTKKRAIDIYVENQANLFAKNAAEYVVYKISQDKNCSLAPFTTTLQTYYDVDVNVSYILSNTNDGCPTSDIALTPADDNADAYAYVRIDVAVTVDDETVTTEPVRVFRRFVEDITPYVY
ncbi:hypothetical protein MNB_SM-7-1414 [hydrothermal vent metagenome]|uniref:Type 4 fimbrial biogenesis protein PilX N-terminal domain-containing protein n=1 Tax=hydrothermal vent metagenome TaxID=652676 RepID=A0A1W1BW69_9ZZZZ